MALTLSNRRFLEEAKDLLGSVLSDCDHTENEDFRPISLWKESLHLIEEILEKKNNNLATAEVILQRDKRVVRDDFPHRLLSNEFLEKNTSADFFPSCSVKTKKEAKDTLVRFSHIKHNVFRGFQALQQYLTHLRSILNYPKKQCIPQLILKKRTTNVSNENSDDVPTVIFSYENEPFPGWSRLLHLRQTGKTKGKVDIHYVSPDGSHRFRSKADLQAYLATHPDSYPPSFNPNSISSGSNKLLNYFNFSGSFCVCQRSDNVEEYQNDTSDQEEEEDEEREAKNIHIDGKGEKLLKEKASKSNNNDYFHSKSCYVECSYGRCGCNGWMHPHCVGLGRVAPFTSQQWPGKLTCPFCSVYLSAACELNNDEIPNNNAANDYSRAERETINSNITKCNINNTSVDNGNSANTIMNQNNNDSIINNNTNNSDNNSDNTNAGDSISPMILNIAQAKKTLSYFDKTIVPLWTLTPAYISETVRWENIHEIDTSSNVNNKYWEIEASNYMPKVYGYNCFSATAFPTTDSNNGWHSYDTPEIELLQFAPFSTLLQPQHNILSETHISRPPKTITLEYESQQFRFPKNLAQKKKTLKPSIHAMFLKENLKQESQARQEQDHEIEYVSAKDKFKFGEKNWQIECKYNYNTINLEDNNKEEEATINLWCKKRKLLGVYRQLAREGTASSGQSGNSDNGNNNTNNGDSIDKISENNNNSNDKNIMADSNDCYKRDHTAVSEDVWIGITGGFLYLNPVLSTYNTTSNIYDSITGTNNSNEIVDKVANMVLLKHQMHTQERSQTEENNKNNASNYNTMTTVDNNIAIIPSVTSATQTTQISQALKEAGLRSMKALQPSHRTANTVFLKQQQTFFQQALRRQFELQLNNNNNNESLSDENAENSYLLPPMLHLWLKDGAVRTVPVVYPPQISQIFPNTVIVYDTEEETENETEIEKIERKQKDQENDINISANMVVDEIHDTVNASSSSIMAIDQAQKSETENENNNSNCGNDGNDNNNDSNNYYSDNVDNAVADGGPNDNIHKIAIAIDENDNNNDNATTDHNNIVAITADTINNEGENNNNNNSEDEVDVATGNLFSVTCLLSHLQQQAFHNNVNVANDSVKNNNDNYNNKRKRWLYGNYYVSRDIPRDCDTNTNDEPQDVCLLRREWLYSDCRRCLRCVLCLTRFRDTDSDTSQVVYVSPSADDANVHIKEVQEGGVKRLYGMHRQCFWLWTLNNNTDNNNANNTVRNVCIDDNNKNDVENTINTDNMKNNDRGVRSNLNEGTENNNVQEPFKVEDSNVCVACGLRGGLVVTAEKAKHLLQKLSSQNANTSITISPCLWHVPCYNFHHYGDIPYDISTSTSNSTSSTSFTPAVVCEVCQGPSRDASTLWRCVARGCTVRAHPLCASLFARGHTCDTSLLSHDSGWLKQVQVSVVDAMDGGTQRREKRGLCMLCPQHTLLSLEHTTLSSEKTAVEEVNEVEQEIENEVERYSKRRRRM